MHWRDNRGSRYKLGLAFNLSCSRQRSWLQVIKIGSGRFRQRGEFTRKVFRKAAERCSENRDVRWKVVPWYQTSSAVTALRACHCTAMGHRLAAHATADPGSRCQCQLRHLGRGHVTSATSWQDSGRWGQREQKRSDH